MMNLGYDIVSGEKASFKVIHETLTVRPDTIRLYNIYLTVLKTLINAHAFPVQSLDNLMHVIFVSCLQKESSQENRSAGLTRNILAAWICVKFLFLMRKIPEIGLF